MEETIPVQGKGLGCRGEGLRFDVVDSYQKHLVKPTHLFHGSFCYSKRGIIY